MVEIIKPEDCRTIEECDEMIKYISENWPLNLLEYTEPYFNRASEISSFQNRYLSAGK